VAAGTEVQPATGALQRVDEERASRRDDVAASAPGQDLGRRLWLGRHLWEHGFGCPLFTIPVAASRVDDLRAFGVFGGCQGRFNIPAVLKVRTAVHPVQHSDVVVREVEGGAMQEFR
jgi:hypothetical protein